MTAPPSDYSLVAQVEDVPDGMLLGVETADGQRVCLYNLRGTIGAVSDVCTHQEFPMSDGTLLPDGSIECAWHGARFDCRSGNVLRQPATDPLPVFEVLVREGRIYVGPRAGP